MPGRPTLSVRYDQIDAIAKNVAPRLKDRGSVRVDIHWSCGTKTRYDAIGCMKQIAHVFLIESPSVVVSNPIRKLVKISIPSATYSIESSDLPRAENAARPINTMASQDMFPKSDMCSDLEYSLFRISLASIFCVISNTPIRIGSRNTISSCLSRYADKTK
jgi:hypothetical protein